MKGLAWLLAALWWLSVVAPPAQAGDESPESRFDAAKQAYDNGNYSEAGRIFGELIREFPSEPALHFNLGNALARQGRVGEAMAAYLRALLLAPRDPDAQANVRFLRESRGLPSPADPSMLEYAFSRLSRDEWESAATASWWAGSALFILSLLMRGAPRLLRSIGWLLLAVALVAVCGVGYWIWYERQPWAVVTATGQQVLFAPLPDATPHFDVPEGFTLRVTATEGEWLRVQDGSRSGWLPQKAVQIVRLE
ncbi:MAG: tetratricopeptide repeat protein [Kiritimatiellae bacterium]|nr:tetratricopeptide repeat protein [Kiritimatiellia bacterium]MDW8459134.1 tetratricopeptide repeat protein [Verrucomicrobiota bacterium]